MSKSTLFCPLTDSKNFTKIHCKKKFPIYMGVTTKVKNFRYKKLQWLINKKSGNVQIYPRVNLENLYSKSHGSGTVGDIWKKHHAVFYNFLKKKIRGNILEIGAGNNSIINYIDKNSKINVFYTVDKQLKKIKKKNIKIIAIKTFFNQKYFNKKKIKELDLVIHSHTFEHLYNPNKFLQTINKILSDSGYHIFSLPNMKPMIKAGYSNAMNFEHPFYYDEDLIDMLLKKNKFRVIKKKYFRQDHSIMYITKKSNHIPKYKYCKYSKNIKLFNNFFNSHRADIARINKIIKHKKNCFIFGAHIFSQFLLFSGLLKKPIMGILDNDLNKQNKFLYGTNYKVFSPAILKNFVSPSVILRVGSYSEEIKKNLSFINKSTQFISYMTLEKVAFLDRDGVINSSKYMGGYIGSLKHFKWIPGVIKAIKFLKEEKYKVVVVTNQSGVARGFFKIKDVIKIHSFIQRRLKMNNTKIDAFYFCPFHKNGIIKRYKKDSLLRKPNIGMFRLAQKRWVIDKKRSFLIGDQITDMKFAKRAKIKGYLFKENNLYKFISKVIFKKK